MRAIRSICLLINAFVLAADPAWAAQAAGSLPEIKKDCATCHRDITRGPALHKPLSSLCLDCHPDRDASSEHRVDIVPSMPVLRLPLVEGKITCITCHDPHANPYGKLLRAPAKALCSRCHPY